jgi:hypothetical protein
MPASKASGVRPPSKDWADERAEKLLAEMRGKPAQVVLRILAGALREVLAKAEADFETFEPLVETFEGRYLLSTVDGFCNDCGIPYAEGEKVWWLGPGHGALCEGCRKASEWTKENKR